MLRVPSESSAITASHNARPKSTAPSQTTGGSSFSALVDSNADAAADNRPSPADASPQPPQQPQASSQPQKSPPASKADKPGDPNSNAETTPKAPDSATAPAAGTVIVGKDGKIVVATDPAGKGDGDQAKDAKTDTEDAQPTPTAAQPAGAVAVVLPVAPAPTNPTVPAATADTATSGSSSTPAVEAAAAAEAAATVIAAPSDPATAAAVQVTAEATGEPAKGESAKTPAKPILTPRQANAMTAEADAGAATSPTTDPQATAAANTTATADKSTAKAAPKKDQADIETARPDAPAKDGGQASDAPASGHRLQAPGVDSSSLSSEASQRAAAAALQTQPQTQTTATAPTTQLHVALATAAAVPLNGVAMEISAQAQIGRNRFEIRLDPPELGRIDVRLDVDHRGQVTSHLTVDKVETLDLLRRDAPQLQRALEDAGLKTGDGGLQFSLRDQSSSNGRDDGNAGKNSQRLIISEDDTVPAEVAGRSYGRMIGASRGVDIRV
ncbi:flagellar hook-length control protein FliK [Bradyrhizobium prioriisuperbiae]|uniref:flagellar hook-length control protein FliK n=1 Tax=Bradyrhizobium prioriisuperbiae TaxID=2854389 RepID=UPI0028E5CC5D|nr:flagellar hook-length control protein FliK [Bradyrhizobium prioritasuperba]